MFNASLNKCLIQAIQVTSLRCSKRCYSSNIILEENNLPPITYCLFSSTYFHCKMLGIPYAAFKCSLTAAITLSLCASEFPTNSDKHSFVELAVSICFGIDLKKILPVVVKTKKAEKPDIFLRTST